LATYDTHDIIVLGASAGGVEALKTVIGGLPSDLPAAVFVVLHIPAGNVSLMPSIINREGTLPAHHPNDFEEITHGKVYVAPPDHHLLVDCEFVRVTRGPTENHHRPAVDPMFRSAAVSYGPRVIGVVLTGTLDDGTAGLQAIKKRGGLAIVQDPKDALYSGMPSSAIENVAVDHILPINEIAPMLAQLVQSPVPDDTLYPVPAGMQLETDIAAMKPTGVADANKLGKPSGFTCPECHGSLWEIDNGKMLRFRCQVGHAYSVNSVLEAQSHALESAIWAALRSFEERIAMSQRLADRARDRNHVRVAQRFDAIVHETETHADVLRQILLQNKDLPTSEEDRAS